MQFANLLDRRAGEIMRTVALNKARRLGIQINADNCRAANTSCQWRVARELQPASDLAALTDHEPLQFDTPRNAHLPKHASPTVHRNICCAAQPP